MRRQLPTVQTCPAELATVVPRTRNLSIDNYLMNHAHIFLANLYDE